MNPELEKVKKIIEKSGHNLNFEVANILRKNNWAVEIGQYYVDDLTDKPREIDIIASKIIPFWSTPDEMLNTDIPNQCEAFLFIECKYLTQPVVFWMDKRNETKTKNALKMVGLHDNQIITSMMNVSGPQFHYLKSENVGKLVQSENSKDIFDTVTTPVKSLIFNRDQVKKRGIYFPVVVCDGSGHLFTQDSEQKDYIILDTNYSYRGLDGRIKGPETFYIDFVFKNQFEKFLGVIENADMLIIRSIESDIYKMKFLRSLTS